MRGPVALALAIFAGTAAGEDNYGCTVLLCLANPAGPMAAPYCVPYIKRLFRDLRKGRAIPRCAMVAAPGGGQVPRAEYGRNYYDLCPQGMTDLAEGANAADMTNGQVYKGIGDGQNQYPMGDGNMPDKVCVDKPRGYRSVEITNEEFINVPVYEQVRLLKAHPSPMIIDMYEGQTLVRRIRW